MEEIKTVSKLVGYELVLNPVNSSMFSDPLSGLSLNYFKDNCNKAEVNDTMDVTRIMKAIQSGILLVKKGDKDYTTEFGGPSPDENWKHVKVVNAPKRPSDDAKDKSLISILNRNKINDILKDINVISDYAVLDRLLELEKMGKNPSSLSRGSIVDALEDRMKSITGMSAARQIKEEKEDIVNAK